MIPAISSPEFWVLFTQIGTAIGHQLWSNIYWGSEDILENKGVCEMAMNSGFSGATSPFQSLGLDPATMILINTWPSSG
jgi:hypothetical protein